MWMLRHDVDGGWETTLIYKQINVHNYCVVIPSNRAYGLTSSN